MKYRLGSLLLEDIDTYVRVTVFNLGGVDAPPRTECTRKACPSDRDVLALVNKIRGHNYADDAVRNACSRVAENARNNKTLLAL